MAKSVLIVGGGSTGVESAGYIAEKYPDKKIGICQRGERLLPVIKGAHEKIHQYMEKDLGITIHLKTEFKGDPKDLGYEMALDCRGYKFSGP